ncbi:MAG: hypothetical protein O3C34_18480 [Proteobacteria bacterium]|nr:hypothetical protein [Pseudomonadota bacterium]
MARLLVLAALAISLGGCAVTAVVGAAASVVGAVVDVTGSVISGTVDVVSSGVSGAIDLATSKEEGAAAVTDQPALSASDATQPVSAPAVSLQGVLP